MAASPNPLDRNNKAGSVGRNNTPVNCWAPTYHVASWKGIEFFCDSSSDEFGRRGDIYEYPLSDYIGYKDLGKKATRYKVEGYLIGVDQVAQTRRMTAAAASGEPGPLVHPIHGELNVACITLTAAADYRRDKKRTKLSFDFVEANESWSPFMDNFSIGNIFGAGNESILFSKDGIWDPGAADMELLNQINGAMSNGLTPVSDVPSFDAQDMLNRWSSGPPVGGIGGAFPQIEPRIPGGEMLPGLTTMIPGMEYPITLHYATDPIDYASATIRRIHTDALKRLREFNAFVVNRMERLAMPSPSAQSLIITTRLIVIRDYAIAAALKAYPTSKDALDDLDFIMAVLDDEEAVATKRCDDVLVRAIRQQRATSAAVILARNIRLPGIAEFPTDGVWPSLVIAQKLYNDGRRHMQLERYNSQMVPLFMGRRVIAPAS